jgi:AraC family transcriptional regulator, regulatory protein of adaptative response / DNA-3-methyladenine glycosylase II
VDSRDRRFDGRFYTAVLTTGVYCRPSCPSRMPLRRNVRFYRHAAAAERAGFRACRRCRPEVAPGSPGWDVRAEQARRALRFIEAGVVDTDGVPGLAARLHVSERQLHRLLTSEVGAGPLALARTRRVQLARLLVDGSDLPLSRVAFAAGFSSLRQFNADLRRALGRPPTELRRARGRAVPAGLALRLGYRQPFDAEPLLGFLAARAIPGVERVAGRCYERIVPGGLLTVDLSGNAVTVRLRVADLRAVGPLVEGVRRLLDLDADPQAVVEALAADPMLGPIVSARPGLRIPGTLDGFELAVRALVGQQVSVGAAATLLGRIVRLAGTPSSEPDASTASCPGSPAPAGGPEQGLEHRFPTPEALATAPLEQAGLPGRRAASIRALAGAVAEGALVLDGTADLDDTRRVLEGLPGVGPWTSGYVALRALGDPDGWPRGDLGLRRAWAALGGRDVDAAAEAWRPWRGYAALHLWSAS